MIDFNKYENFSKSEFNRPEGIDEEALEFLQQLRTYVGVGFIMTSDYRPPEANAQAGGSGFSLHLTGRAFDFGLVEWTPEVLWKLAEGVILLGKANDWPNTQLEIVDNPGVDRHIHIGWYPYGDTRQSKLYVKPT